MYYNYFHINLIIRLADLCFYVLKTYNSYKCSFVLKLNVLFSLLTGLGGGLPIPKTTIGRIKKDNRIREILSVIIVDHYT